MLMVIHTQMYARSIPHHTATSLQQLVTVVTAVYYASPRPYTFLLCIADILISNISNATTSVYAIQHTSILSIVICNYI